MICRFRRGRTTPENAGADEGGIRRQGLPAVLVRALPGALSGAPSRALSGVRTRPGLLTRPSLLAWTAAGLVLFALALSPVLAPVAAQGAPALAPTPGSNLEVGPEQTSEQTSGVSSAPAPGVKISVDRPGVYAVPMDELRDLVGPAVDRPGARLRLTHLDRPVPFWIDRIERLGAPGASSGTPADPSSGAGSGSSRSLVFVAAISLFRPDDLRDARPLAVLELTPEAASAEGGAAARSDHPEAGPGRQGARDDGPPGVGVSDRGAARESSGGGDFEPAGGARADGATGVGGDGEESPESSAPVATVRRMLHLEQNNLRAAVTEGDVPLVDTLWFWATLTQNSSSQLEVDLGDLSDRVDPEGGEALDLEITVRLLGWSRTNVPDGMAQHHVDLFLNDQKIGESVFDGRQTVSLHAADVPASLLRAGSNVLRIKVPARPVEGSPDPLLDFVYVDWVEVGYRVRSPLADADAPLLVEAASTPRWLADPEGSPKARLFGVTDDGTNRWTVARRVDGGWLLPPSEPGDTTDATDLADGSGTAEVWVVDEDQIGAPVAVEPLSVGARSVPADAEYLMIAPPELMAGAERLAAFHRRLGRTVAVVDANAIFDQFGGGERSPQAIRRFLDQQVARSDRLHWVLLIGDADWFTPDDRWPSLRPDPNDRNRIPAWTFLSLYGPAASDHYYAMDPDDEAAPRFAIGRLPVIDPAVLDAYVSKEIAWVEAGEDLSSRPMLMMSDSTKGSLLHQRRLRERLADLPIERIGAEPVAGDPAADDAAVAAFGRHPSLVYFGGHGSRFMWELGDPMQPSPETFFDLDDVARLAPTVDQPIVLSMSCGTAPFDHPNAGSLGEAMVLSGDRGAVAFIGASAALLTPPRFGEALVRNLLEMETVGDAFMAAERQLGRAQVSHLYNLLGDPALPLDPAQHQDGGTE